MKNREELLKKKYAELHEENLAIMRNRVKEARQEAADKCARRIERMRLDLIFANEAAKIWMLRAKELGYKK